MKKIVFVFAFLFTISIQVNAQWEWQNPKPQGHNLNTIEILDNNIIIAAGDQGTIIRSVDGGETWEIRQMENTQIRFTASTSNKQNKIWLAGIDINLNGKLYFSENSGSTWELISEHPFLEYNNLFVFEDEVAFASSDSTVFKSIDSGLDWFELNLPSLTWVQDIYFLNSNEGWIVTDPFKCYTTTNGGISWDSLNVSSLPEQTQIDDMYFINENLGWIIIRGYGILKTIDSGLNWTLKQFSEYSLNSFLFVDDSIVFVSGNDGEIYKSTDACESFQLVYPADGKMKMKISSTGLNNIWAVGINGKIVKSTDNGNYWLTESNGYYFTNFTGMKFTSKRTGYVSGDNKILKTTDEGNIWIPCFEEWNLFVHSIFFLNNDLGWAITTHLGGYDANLWKTTNGGNNWTNIWQSSNPASSNEIIFIDSLNGLIIFSNHIIKTTDGGNNWDFVNNLTYDAICFLTSNSGWKTSHTINGFDINGIISKTTDGGLNWIPVEQDSLDLITDIKFFNNILGVAVGGDESMYYSGKYNFLITTDGGITWQKNTFDMIFKGIYFVDNLHAIASVTEHGIDKIIYSSNGGKTWVNQYVFSHGDFDGLGKISFVDSDNGWIPGSYSTLLHTTNGGVTFIEDGENNFTQLKDFLLQQNYPNPFNPSTRIQYAISSTQFVTFKVYDLLGREVATLVNEEKPAGNYEVDFTVGRDSSPATASGVYFYKLTAGDFVETKKMILLK